MNMKKISGFLITIVLTIVFLQSSYSQLDRIDFLRGGTDDANLLFKEYLTPYANILGANLNSGWYNTAKPHKLGGFDITITLNAAWAPSADRIFNLTELALSSDATITGGTETPTVAGKKTETRPEIVYAKDIVGVGTDIEYARYTMPDGTGLSYLPLPMVQLGIGMPLGTDVSVRFLPSLDLGDPGNIGLWGIGLKHSISQHIPVLKEVPVLDISAQGGYTKLSTYANLNYDPLDIVEDQNHDYVNDMNVWLDQKLEMEITAWTVNMLVSETLPVVTFYQGIGYSNSEVNLGLTGNFPFPSIETDSGSDYFGEVVVKDVPNEGIIKDPIDLQMDSHKNLRLNAGMRIKLGVFTINFDYTRANYNVLTAGIGISFK